jgi:hypothetical protein
MRSRIVRIILPVLAAGILHAEVSAPQLGVIRCSDGLVRAVYGLAGNFILANKVLAPAGAVSFSDRAGLMAKNGAIQLVKADGAPLGKYESQDSKPVLNVDGDVESAIVWLPSEHSVLRWTGASFRLYPLAPLEGEVTAIKATAPDRAQLLILSDDGNISRATVTLSTGELVSLNVVPEASGAAFAQQSALISHERDGLVIETPDGVRQHLPVPSDVVIERMSSEWLHLSSVRTNQDWALHVAGSQVELFILPAVQRHEEAGK